MSAEPFALVGHDIAFNEIRARLAGDLHAVDEPERRFSRLYLDSFDWRLYRAGLLLAFESEGNAARLACLERDGTPVASAAAETSPRFVAEISDADLRDRLAPIDGRALLPLVQVETRSRPIRFLDGEAKTVLRASVEQSTVVDAPRGSAMPVRVELHTVRGYDAVRSHALARADAEPRLGLTGDDVLAQALGAIGRRPLDYTGKFAPELPEDISAGAAIAAVIQALIAAMRANEAGIRDDIDSEFLHDFRVAVRRLRSVLAQMKATLPADMIARLREDLAWVGQVTTPVRDLDVYLAEIDALKASLPEAMREDLEPLRPFIAARRRTARDEMIKALSGRRYRTLMQNVDGFLAQPKSAGGEPGDADEPAIAIAGQRILKLYRRARRQGRAIEDSSPADDLHELRKTCKKLRYMIEAFGTLFSKDGTRPALKRLRELQAILGDIQDLAVQQEELRRFGDELLAEGRSGAGVLMAMGALSEILLERQAATRQAFADGFRPFASGKTRALFAETFTSG